LGGPSFLRLGVSETASPPLLSTCLQSIFAELQIGHSLLQFPLSHTGLPICILFSWSTSSSDSLPRKLSLRFVTGVSWPRMKKHYSHLNRPAVLCRLREPESLPTSPHIQQYPVLRRREEFSTLRVLSLSSMYSLSTEFLQQHAFCHIRNDSDPIRDWHASSKLRNPHANIALSM
jgi:hypothetical protein